MTTRLPIGQFYLFCHPCILLFFHFVYAKKLILRYAICNLQIHWTKTAKMLTSAVFLRIHLQTAYTIFRVKVKVIPRQAEVALGVPVRLRPRIFSTFGTTSVVGRQPNAPATFTAGEIPGTHFQRLSRPQGTWFCRKEPRRKSPVTPGEIYPGTVRLVAQ